MSDGIFMVILGTILLASARWWVPRQMRRAREKAARAGLADRFDTELRSAPYRVALGAVTLAGGVLLIVGAVLAAEGR